MSVSKSQMKNYLNTQGCLATDYIAFSTSISELACVRETVTRQRCVFTTLRTEEFSDLFAGIYPA
ncbi:hypothetical protein BZ160_17975 [Pantoea vagans]|jgi:hypothetical protein|uniref:Uncharacterized protein n=4 Tax=Pantoea TaxID=53335 RepID=A0A6I6K505_ENTAG|nr:hypothetical protein BEE12_05165 [Pantoea agglomerans]ERM10782.1 hypothetical protein L584_11565 [Pantoea agglomerans Tx10]KAF6630140.1 hypothetical protein HFD95_17240 [Pantoea sp. EKM10T]KAF6675558.1 hypothetical protein HFD87_14725 [Pantoea sp. EKM21T]KAF6679196.1 hypothetical protein HFD94_16865 [Pantoea sp. EKM20T]KAF6681311.1 hypothetical protein HFD90_13395 [Pantoea sp. EKM22T]KDA94461.1 hypothetical protein T296_11030 [Pantoea agglomerans Eh318]KNH30456.1 hypothetical protein ACS7